jgi:monoamine oxidase
MKNTDVVIVGGGISGLYAAEKCIERGLSVIVLEKDARMGGRIHTEYKKHYHYETGAGRLSVNHTLLRSLLEKHGLHLVPISGPMKYNNKHSPVGRILREVMSYAKSYDVATLTSMTFREFCERVIGHNETALLINAFGYNAEFEVANAYTAIDMFKRDFLKRSYMACTEGFSELVKRMTSHVATHARVYRSTKVYNIEENPDKCIVYATDGRNIERKYVCKVVICAIPKSALEMMQHVTISQKRLLESVDAVSLNRVYGKFDTPWFRNINRTTTDNPIRQFIPVNKDQGLAMVSYSDTRYADYWHTQARMGQAHMKQEVLRQLHAVFPDVKHIPSPRWVQSYYWSDGVHLWKPGMDVNAIIPKIRHMTKRMFVVGEAFCKVQGWIEGALESVESVFDEVVGVVSDRTGKYLV